MTNIEPYDQSPWANSSRDCDYCGDGYDYDERHRHLYYVSREGASLHTADELVNIFMYDVCDILDTIGQTYPADLRENADQYSALLDSRRHMGVAWLDPEQGDPEIHDELDVYESALSDAGYSVDWDDGYRIYQIQTAETDQ